MANRYGTVLVFDESMTESEIRLAMKKIEFALDNGWITSTLPKAPYILQEFNDEYEWPTWYTP